MNDIRINAIAPPSKKVPYTTISICFFDDLVKEIRKLCYMKENETRTFHIGKGLYLIIIDNEACITSKPIK